MNYKPVTTAGVILSFHSAMYGLGVALSSADFTRLIIYPEIATLLSPVIFGLIMIVSAGLSLYGYNRQSDFWVKLGSRAQALVWLFITTLYLLAEAYFVAFTNGGVWALLTFSIGYAFLNRDAWWVGTGGEMDNRIRHDFVLD